MGSRSVPAGSAWPKSLKLAWKTNVGEGHSSPVVAGERVFVFARQGEVEQLLSLDLATGRVIWRQGEPVPYTMNPAAMGHGKGPKSTPAVRDGKAYTLGISGILTCREAASGRLVWRKDSRGRFREASPTYGAAQSPLLDGGFVIVHVGGPGDGALTAFDANTGAVKWEWKGDGPAYASPVVAEVAGVRQVVAFTEGHLVGLSAASGALLWKLPFTTEYTQNAVTPVVRGSTVYYSGLDKGVHAVEIVRRGDGFSAEPRWSNTEVSAYMSAPVLDGDALYGLSHRKKGQLFALDARSGRALWTSDGRQGDNASLVVAGDALVVVTTEAESRSSRVRRLQIRPALASKTMRAKCTSLVFASCLPWSCSASASSSYFRVQRARLATSFTRKPAGTTARWAQTGLSATVYLARGA